MEPLLRRLTQPLLHIRTSSGCFLVRVIVIVTFNAVISYIYQEGQTSLTELAEQDQCLTLSPKSGVFIILLELIPLHHVILLNALLCSL